MTQNRSSAVMQQRVEPHKSLDDFPTPPWATRALCEYLDREAWIAPWLTVREPAANRGYMARTLSEYFAEVDASDVHDYGVGYPVRDFLFGPLPEAVHWTITNPPFRLGLEFIERAIDSSRVGVAVIVRNAFIEGAERHERLFSVNPPTLVLQHVERVPMVKGRYEPTASTATAYCWLVWLQGEKGAPTRLDWIAPCRSRPFRKEDERIATA
jgi:hypothetical protein